MQSHCTVFETLAFFFQLQMYHQDPIFGRSVSPPPSESVLLSDPCYEHFPIRRESQGIDESSDWNAHNFRNDTELLNLPQANETIVRSCAIQTTNMKERIEKRTITSIIPEAMRSVFTYAATAVIQCGCWLEGFKPCALCTDSTGFLLLLVHTETLL